MFNDLEQLQADRYVIIHADDFGMCHTTNRAILDLFSQGAITSTTLMVNCPWALEATKAAVQNRELDIGVHFTLTSEWDVYKWGPIVQAQQVDTLVDEHGYFPQTIDHMKYADHEQVRAELYAQMERAIRMGVEPTHLDNHMGSLRPHHFDLFIEIAANYNLPIRFAKSRITSSEEGEKIAHRLREQGILHPNEIIGLQFYFDEEVPYEVIKQRAIKTLRSLKPGVTELVFHPSRATDELKAITDTWPYRQYEYDLFLDPDVQAVIDEEGIKRIGWRELRDLQRKLNS